MDWKADVHERQQWRLEAFLKTSGVPPPKQYHEHDATCLRALFLADQAVQQHTLPQLKRPNRKPRVVTAQQHQQPNQPQVLLQQQAHCTAVTSHSQGHRSDGHHCSFATATPTWLFTAQQQTSGSAAGTSCSVQHQQGAILQEQLSSNTAQPAAPASIESTATLQHLPAASVATDSSSCSCHTEHQHNQYGNGLVRMVLEPSDATTIQQNSSDSTLLQYNSSGTYHQDPTAHANRTKFLTTATSAASAPEFSPSALLPEQSELTCWADQQQQQQHHTGDVSYCAPAVATLSAWRPCLIAAADADGTNDNVTVTPITGDPTAAEDHSTDDAALSTDASFSSGVGRALLRTINSMTPHISTNKSQWFIRWDSAAEHEHLPHLQQYNKEQQQHSKQSAGAVAVGDEVVTLSCGRNRQATAMHSKGLSTDSTHVKPIDSSSSTSSKELDGAKAAAKHHSASSSTMDGEDSTDLVQELNRLSFRHLLHQAVSPAVLRPVACLVLLVLSALRVLAYAAGSDVVAGHMENIWLAACASILYLVLLTLGAAVVFAFMPRLQLLQFAGQKLEAAYQGAALNSQRTADMCLGGVWCLLALSYSIQTSQSSAADVQAVTCTATLRCGPMLALLLLACFCARSSLYGRARGPLLLLSRLATPTQSSLQVVAVSHATVKSVLLPALLHAVVLSTCMLVPASVFASMQLLQFTALLLASLLGSGLNMSALYVLQLFVAVVFVPCLVAFACEMAARRAYLAAWLDRSQHNSSASSCKTAIGCQSGTHTSKMAPSCKQSPWGRVMWPWWS